jgi:hypothetical protein
MAKLQELIQYSKQNPDSDVAVKTRRAIEGGAYDEEAAASGIDLSWAGRPAPTAQPPKQASPVLDTVVGAAKSVGSSIANTARIAAKQGPKVVASTILPAAGALPIPGTDKIPAVGSVLDTVDQSLEADNETQQTAKDVTDIAQLALPIVGGAARAVAGLPKFAQSLEKASLRLTPVQKRELGTKLNGITKWLVENKITGNPSERLSRVDDIYEATEKRLQNFLDTNNTAKSIWVNRSNILNQLEALKASFKNSRDYQAAVRQIDDAKALFEKGGTFVREKIPIARLNELKRSTAAGAFNKAGTKVLDEVEFKIADLFKDSIEKATKGLKIGGDDIANFNQKYGTIINARKLLQAAEGRNEVGLVGRIIAMLGGAGVGASVGGVGGAVAGPIVAERLAPILAGTKARSAIGQAARVIGKAGGAAKKIVAPAIIGGSAAVTDKLRDLLPGNRK